MYNKMSSYKAYNAAEDRIIWKKKKKNRSKAYRFDPRSKELH